MASVQSGAYNTGLGAEPLIKKLKRRRLLKLKLCWLLPHIDRSIVCCGDHRRSAGLFWVAGLLVQYQNATPFSLKMGLQLLRTNQLAVLSL